MKHEGWSRNVLCLWLLRCTDLLTREKARRIALSKNPINTHAVDAHDPRSHPRREWRGFFSFHLLAAALT